ncbi:hypothetical protein [Streptomyces buecherae]|uniref:hypothetical protein n=1 Tax=Streptomyces buecherae TaxID=2763006 RepID=UPI0037BA494C
MSTTATGAAVTVHPAAVPTGEPADLRIRIQAPRPCRLLTLRLPEGLARDIRTVRATGPGWLTRHPGPGTVEVRPAPDASSPAEEDLTVTLTGLRPYGAPATRELTVTAELATGTGDTTRLTSRHHLVQLPAGTVPLTGFQAQPLNPERGKQVRLTWTGPQAPGYVLVRSDEPDSTGKSITPAYGAYNSCSFTPEKPVTDAVVAFALIHGTDRALTWAMARQGDIRAGSLAVKGTVNVLGAPVKLLYRAKGGTRRHAETDGFIAVSLATEGGTVRAELKLGSTVHHLHNATVGTETHLQLPVPKGTAVTYHIAAGAEKALSTLTWFPLGTGAHGG